MRKKDSLRNWGCDRSASCWTPRTRQARCRPHCENGILRWMYIPPVLRLHTIVFTYRPQIVIFGPMVVHWYRFLERAIKIPGRPNAEILARVATDQLVFTPVNMLFFFSTLSVMEGGNPKDKLDANYWTGLKTNWMVWPAVQLVNFKLVPLDHRLLVVNFISLGEFSLLFSPKMRCATGFCGIMKPWECGFQYTAPTNAIWADRMELVSQLPQPAKGPKARSEWENQGSTCLSHNYRQKLEEAEHRAFFSFLFFQLCSTPY